MLPQHKAEQVSGSTNIHSCLALQLLICFLPYLEILILALYKSHSHAVPSNTMQFFPQNLQKPLTCRSSNIYLCQYKYIPTPGQANSFNNYMMSLAAQIEKTREKKKHTRKKPQTKGTMRTDDHRNKKLEFLLKANTSFRNHKKKKSDSLKSMMERIALSLELRW